MTPATAGPEATPIRRRMGTPADISADPTVACIASAMSSVAAAMVLARFRCTGDDQVGVTDRLDLLEPVPLRERIEAAEDLVQNVDDPCGCLSRREGSELHHVREEDRHFIVVVSDDALSLLEALGDRARQNIEKKGVGLGLGAHSLAVDEEHEPHRDRGWDEEVDRGQEELDRKSTRLNSSHEWI